MCKTKKNATRFIFLYNEVVICVLNCLCYSKYTMPSIHQPENGACVIVSAVKWTHDA